MVVLFKDLLPINQGASDLSFILWFWLFNQASYQLHLNDEHFRRLFMNFGVLKVYLKVLGQEHQKLVLLTLSWCFGFFFGVASLIFHEMCQLVT